MALRKRMSPDQQIYYMPTTLLIRGNISDDEFDEIKKAFEPVGITVDRPINKAEWAQDALHFVFSDFSAVSYIRDGLLTLAQAKVLKRVWAYSKKKNREDCEVSFDKTIRYANKTFTIVITCHFNHIETIDTQIDFVLTPTILRRIPTGSRFYVQGHENQTIKIIVVERGTGRQYPLN